VSVSAATRFPQWQNGAAARPDPPLLDPGDSQALIGLVAQFGGPQMEESAEPAKAELGNQAAYRLCSLRARAAIAPQPGNCRQDDERPEAGGAARRGDLGMPCGFFPGLAREMGPCGGGRVHEYEGMLQPEPGRRRKGVDRTLAIASMGENPRAHAVCDGRVRIDLDGALEGGDAAVELVAIDGAPPSTQWFHASSSLRRIAASEAASARPAVSPGSFVQPNAVCQQQPIASA
jgi:hypothetical protein